jgi:pyridoxal 5'-phosphate synthase glutaminase subunit Pdx2
MAIGVLALQGDFGLHSKALDRLGLESVEVRLPRQLDQVEGLIMPGGESTTLLKLLDEWGFVPALEKFHAAGKPIMGTCAGLILLAREGRPSRPRWSHDITAERNAHGRAEGSFETEGEADLGAGSSLSRWYSSGSTHTADWGRPSPARVCTAGNARWPARAAPVVAFPPS